MKTSQKNIVVTVLFALLIFGISLLCILKPADVFSKSERRELASFPEFSLERLIDGGFISDFETYATERFPSRDFFRRIKATVSTKFFKKLDNNGLFDMDGHISKIDSQLNAYMLNHSAERFSYIYSTYLKDKDMNIYLSIIPDKNYYLLKDKIYPSLDYNKLVEEMKAKTEYMKYIDVTHLLSSDDYYRTDTHWKQENITDIAEYFLADMGTDGGFSYTENIFEKPFDGVYAGQYAMPFESDELKYLTNEIIDNFIVTYYDSGKGKRGELYNIDKANGKGSYEMFLSGAMPLVTIDNSAAVNDKELIIFRDSFGSSLSPLLAQGYKKTTIIDTRYIKSDYIGSFVNFNENADVLFLYSATLLNNSLAIQ